MAAPSLDWHQVVSEAKQVSADAYLATVDAHGMPHIAFVAPGFGDERIFIATDATTAKAKHIASNASVALHWPVNESNRQILIRGLAHILEGEAKVAAWEAGHFDWDIAAWYEGPEDPSLALIEVMPHSAIVGRAHGDAIGRWHRET